MKKKKINKTEMKQIDENKAREYYEKINSKEKIMRNIFKYLYKRTCKPCACNCATTDALTTRTSDPVGKFPVSMLFVYF